MCPPRPPWTSLVVYFITVMHGVRRHPPPPVLLSAAKAQCDLPPGGAPTWSKVPMPHLSKTRPPRRRRTQSQRGRPCSGCTMVQYRITRDRGSGWAGKKCLPAMAPTTPTTAGPARSIGGGGFVCTAAQAVWQRRGARRPGCPGPRLKRRGGLSYELLGSIG